MELVKFSMLSVHLILMLVSSLPPPPTSTKGWVQHYMYICITVHHFGLRSFEIT